MKIIKHIQTLKQKRFYPANYSKDWITRSYLHMGKTPISLSVLI